MPKKTIRDFNPKFGLKLAVMIGCIGAGAAYGAERYTIGLDTQEHPCIDASVFIIDKWDRPAASEVERNELLAVRLTDAQMPTRAKWSPTTVMVKRAVAVRGGDIAHVRADGISFEGQGETWTHGTALEAARLLGGTIGEFIRDVTLEEDELFMMGDNTMTYDSRYYGAVKDSQIVGRVLWAF